ncbi:amine oxidase, partial [Jaminaea rosea]
CLYARVDGEVVARSEPVEVVENEREVRRRKRSEKMKMADLEHYGTWFDGVSSVKPGFVTQNAKSSRLAVVGAGMSGLMTTLLLDSVGLHNYTLIEASQRYGGRLETEYFDEDKDKHVYQEIGGMRFPDLLFDPISGKNLTMRDSQIVFQLGEELNRINAGNRNRSVDFIPWIQSAPGNLVYRSNFKMPNGLPPSNAQLKENPDLIPTTKPSDDLAAAQKLVANMTSTAALRASIATNIWQAHEEWISHGLDDFSAFSYLHNKNNFTLDTVDQITGQSYNLAENFWDIAYGDNTYFSNNTVQWKTIDRGMSQLPNAFWGTPAANKTVMGRKIYRVDNEEDGRVRLHWKPSNAASVREAKSESFDYAVISAPFSVAKFWRMPNISPSFTRAVKTLKYSSACKVALHFKSRFWERAPFSPPIYGGCSVTDLPGIRNVCYPPYGLNSTGPAVILGEYVSNDDADRMASWPEDAHVQHVLDGVAEMHGGEVVYDEFVSGMRKCWGIDEFEAASWAAPMAGQHKLYLPEYYKTHNGTIWVGDSTSVTHGWVSGALESAVRGTVQLLLELGLVDEAKQVTKTWMGRWISV